MSARKFPRDMPRAVQAAVRAAMELADISGEVVGGMLALQEALGHDDSASTRRVVIEGESWGYMRRAGPIGHGPRRLFVVEARANPHASCRNCGVPKPPNRYEHCQTCKVAFRRDRSWRMTAVAMLVDGKAPPAIAAAVSQPLFPGRDDGPLVGVVAFLLGEVPALVPRAWSDAYNVVVGSHKKAHGALSSRARQRRRRGRGNDEQATTPTETTPSTTTCEAT